MILVDVVNHLVEWIRFLALPGSLYSTLVGAQGLLAVIVLGVVCGSVGSLVVGNRMAFFSDALAHCAFAGVAFGLIIGLLSGAEGSGFSAWITLIMVLFGILMGLSIAFVQDRTSQANDTVIGVFFAGAIGLGAVFLAAGGTRRYFPPEQFLFGSLATISKEDIVVLILLNVVTFGILIWLYNRLVFSSFNPSLARARGIPIRFCRYAFIIILALIVNICLRTVGVLLINGLLIVPAAAAGNLCRNMRQLFISSIILCVSCGVIGQWLSFELNIFTGLQLGEGGSIIVVSVVFYFISIFFRRSA